MSKQEQALVAFNRGIISPLALARIDLKRLALSAQTMTNWMPRALGSMMLRPGLQYIGATASNNAARFIPFIYSGTDMAMMEFTNQLLRIWISDALITRVSVSSAVTNGTFDTDVTGWTDNDEAGATSAWVTGGYMGLTGNGTAYAIRDQTVTVAAGDQNKEHALRIIINRGPVILRVGTSTTDDSYVRETTLETGNHSLAFTPTGDFNIRFKSALKRQVLVDSVAVESSGVMTLPTAFPTADLGLLRAGPESQSADVVFMASDADECPIRIERRATRSWSVVQYKSDDGPFRTENITPITMTPGALSGNTTLTASQPIFKTTHAPSANSPGALFRHTSSGQRVTASVTAENQFTSAISVTGTGTQRPFTVIRSNTWVATVTLQRSLESSSGPWVDVTTYTTNGTVSYDDGLSNQDAWYRIGVKTGGFTSGTCDLELNYSGGSISGICRVTSYSSVTVANVEVIQDFGSTASTVDWAEGQWSDYRRWPSACAFYESRLVFAGRDKINASVTDDFHSFPETYEGDAGPLSLSIGSGPVDTINWILPLQRLLLGGATSEHSCRSSALDEPLTPTNFNIKPASGQGSAGVQAIKLDSRGIYVQRGGTRLFELDWNTSGLEYDSQDLTLLCPEIGKPMINRIAVQRQPDTRIHCVRSDGTVAVLVNDKRENVLAWVEITTDGLVEDVIVMPSASGEDEDRVYYIVNRTINSATVRYLEKFALESECVGGTLNKQADSFIVFTNSPASVTVTGLTHLVGESVVVWANSGSADDTSGNIKTFVVNGSGEITLDAAATTGVVGLAYNSQFLSAKLGQALSRHKRINTLGLILADTHAKGIQFGADFTTMDYLPLMYNGALVDSEAVYSEFDTEPIPFPGTWSTDARLALKAQAPRPCTVLAAVVNGEVI